MVGFVAFLREVRAPFLDLLPGMAGLGNCGSRFTRLNTKRAVAEKYLARRFLGTLRASGNG